MSIFMRCGLAWMLCASCFLFSSAASGQAPKAGDASPEEARDRQAAERFLTLLEKQPRLGTSLDKVYGFHIERGTLDDFLAAQKKKTADPKQAGTAWMLIGLMELQRGRDADAVAALQEAEKLRTEDPYASSYLAKAMLLVGRTDDAAAAYERAISRKPPRTDLLDLYQQLGQIHQRARKAKEALAVWDRMEKAFPDDQRVQEQIATTLADENDHAGALERFEKLAAKATDAYRKVQYQIRVGELKLRLGRNDEALQGLESLLSQLKPDSWLHRDVRTRIEATFLKTDDYDGLSKYYIQWLAKHGDDLDAMSRLANFLALQGRIPEAEEWYRKAIKLAPTNKSLRRALIGQLAQAKRVPDAAAEYAELDKLEPNNPDTLRAWGQMLIDDESQPEPVRKKQATTIWQKMLAVKPKDPVTTSQVADLLRQAKLTDEAIALYRKAIELAPTEPQYREYLGEYLHVLDRGPEAIAVWKEIATGEKKNTRTLIRLAEVYRGFGYRDQSLETMATACALDPEFADLLRYASLLREATKFDDSLSQLTRAEKLAENEDEREQVLMERIKTYVESEKLTEQIAALETQVGKEGTTVQWRTLALLFEAARRPSDATKAITQALSRDEKSVPSWTVAARIYENSGGFTDAIKANQQLAALDRRARSDYLQRIAGLQMRLGKAEEALKAGQEVIASAPGNPEHYQFYAALCFQLGRQDDGLNALRRAVRVNPSDQKALVTLATSLGEQFRTEEAIELYWRAFETAENVDDRNSIVNSLAPLYLRINQFDRMVAKLDRIGKEQKAERESTMWMATAHQAAGDIGSARDLLAKLLTEESKDTQLLSQLVKLAEAEFDLEQALAYQRRINEIAPSKEGSQRLAGMLMRTGATEEAEALWLEAARTDRQPHRIYEAIDEMIVHNRFEAALKLSEQLLRDRPQDWEALYRAGLSLWKLKRQDEAVKRLEQLRTLPIPETTLSAKAEFQKQQAQQRKASPATAVAARAVNAYGYPVNYPAPLMRQQSLHQIQQAFGVNDENYGYSSATRTIWSPQDYAQARMVAPSLEFARATIANKVPEVVARLEERLDKAEVSTEELWDIYGMASLAQNYASNAAVAENKPAKPPLMNRVARKLSDRDEPAGKLIYLSSLSSRGGYRTVTSARGTSTTRQQAEPLSTAELEHAKACYHAVAQAHPEWLEWSSIETILVSEMKLAKRDAEAEALYKETLGRAHDYRSVRVAMSLAMALEKFDDMEQLLAKHIQEIQTQPGMGSQVVLSLWSQIVSMANQKKDKAAAQSAVIKAITSHASAATSQPPQRRSSSVNSGSSSGGIHVSYQGANGQYRSMRLTYPLPNSYYDTSAVSTLYSFFSMMKESEQLPETLAALKSRAEQAEGDSKVMLYLVQTYWLWWNEQKTEALEQLQSLTKIVPEQHALQMELAQMLLQNGEERNALTVLDRFEPTDNGMLRDRELLALQAAVSLSDVDRAKKGAERLFGMQLDATVQFQLAQLMHQLGMHEMAENVLTRIRKRSGNQSNTLAQLMQQYVSQGNNDAASQIALQLMRRGTPNSSTRNSRTTDDVNREQALRVLSQTGQLTKIIERVEGQLAKSPNSVMLLESLAEYYRASGKNDKSQELLERLAKNQPNDARALLSRAAQLVRSGNHKGACDLYILALKAEPTCFDDRYYDFRTAFQQAKRMPDLAATILEVDFSGSRQYYRFTELSRELIREPATKDLGLKVFKKAWASFPRSRNSLLSNMYDDQFWQTDDAYQYAREGVIPKAGSSFGPWQGIADSLSYSGDGKVTGLLTRLVKLTQSKERQEQFVGDVNAAVKEFPNWSGGVAIQAVFAAKSGKVDEARKSMRNLLDTRGVDPRAAIVIAQEFDEIAELRPLSIRLLQTAMTDDRNGNFSDGYSYHPGRYLALLYHRSGERHKARETVMAVLKSQDFSQYAANNPGYPEYNELRSLVSAGQDFQKMEMPLEAIRLFDQGLSDTNRIAAAARWGSSMTNELQRGRQAAEQALTPKVLAQELEGWVRMPLSEDRPADALNPEKPRDPKTSTKPSPVVDFMLSVQPRTVDAARISSLFENALSAAVGKPVAAPAVVAVPDDARVRPVSPVQRTFVGFEAAARKSASATATPPSAASAAILTKLRQQLAEAGAKAVDDLSVPAAVALVELLDPRSDEAAAAKAIAVLAERVTSLPADAASTADGDIAIWLVARQGRQHKSAAVREAAQKLAERTLTLARGSTDRIWLMALLREQGQFALEAGEKAAAERMWSDLLDEIVRARPDEKPSTRKPAAGF